MAKKKITKKLNKNFNIFDDGGDIASMVGGATGGILSSIPNINEGKNTNGIESDIYTAIYGDSSQDPIARMVNDLTGNSTKNVINTLNQKDKFNADNNEDLISKWNDIGILNTYNTDKNLVGKTLLSTALGAPWLDFKNNGVQFDTDNLIASAKGAANGSSFGPWGALAGGILGGVTNLVSRMGRNNRIRKINKAIENRNAYLQDSFSNLSSNIDKQNDFGTMASYAAYGGPLNIFGDGAIDYELAKENLYNKQLSAMSKYKMSSMPNSFETPELAIFSKGGKVHIKKANIGQHGGDFSNGVTIIGNGGTHEENPMEGVPMGVAPDGTPNLVEQGEVKFNDYIFSNRLFADDKLLETVNLPKSYNGHSFANIAENLSKESSERPNDPISKRGLMSAMTRLQQAQEQLRMKEQNKQFNKNKHYFSKGGFPEVNTPDDFELYVPEREEPYTGPSLKVNGNSPELYNPRTGEIISFNTPEKETPHTKSNNNFTWLRYAPAVGAGLGVLTDALGWTNNPDYGNADLVGNAVDNLTNVEFTPIGNYLTYRPLDRNYYINKLNSQAGAIRRAIVNQSGGNRTTALAGLLAADYNTQNALGNLARQAEEYNLNQRNAVETFNRGTNQFNSEIALRTALANKENEKTRLQARITQAQLRDQADARASAGRAANLTNLFDSLGNIGREEFSRNMIQTSPEFYYSIDRKGDIIYKNGYDALSEVEKKVVRDAANKDKNRRKAKGGYLTIRGGK